MSNLDYYQFSDNLHDGSSDSMKRRDVEAHSKTQMLGESQLKLLYFFSALTLVCISHFAKFFYLEAGLTITQIGCLQCVFYLSRFIGAYAVESVEDWLVNTHRAGSNACMRSLRKIIIVSLVLSSAFWAILLFKPMQQFAPFAVCIFLGSLTVSSSHGFLDLVTFDTIASSSMKISYSALRFWGLMALMLGSVIIGALIDGLHHYVVFYLFLGFNAIFLILVFAWFPYEHHRPRTYHENSLGQNMCGFGVFHVYIFLFCYGMLNSMPEILMLHLRVVYGLSYTNLGLLIALLAFAELTAYFCIHGCTSCISFICQGPLTSMTLLSLLFSSLRFTLWSELDSVAAFFVLEIFQTMLVTMFWMIALQTVKHLVPYLAQGSINDDLESIWHFQSRACGVLVGCILYDTLGSNACFNLYSGCALVLLVYYFFSFCPCQGEIVIHEFEEDSTLMPSKKFSEQLMDDGETEEVIQEEPSGSNDLADQADDDDFMGDLGEQQYWEDAILEISDSGASENRSETKPLWNEWINKQSGPINKNAAFHQKRHFNSTILVS